MKAIVCKIGARVLLLALGLNLLSLARAEETSALDVGRLSSGDSTNVVPHEVKPTADGGRIAYFTTELLGDYQYLRRPIDSTISARMFDAYVSALDLQHSHFLQSDLQEFEDEGYRTNLSRLMLNNWRRDSDIKPAYEIFSRFKDRLRQHVAYVDELLKTEKFDFASDDRIRLDRHDQAYPKSLDEAKQLWRERLRYDYLMEKISRETRRTNASAAAVSTNSTIAPKEKAGPAKSMHDEIVETLGKDYHRLLRNFDGYDTYDVLERYLEALARSYDPHSDYEGPVDYQDFAMTMNLSLTGIGAVLQMKDDYCTIEDLMSGPAKLSGKIKIGDRIMAVAQSNQPPVNIFGMQINKAVKLIRGPKGTEVRLTIIPYGASESTTEVVPLTRDEVKLENGEAKGKILEVPDTTGKKVRLGVIDLPSFYATIDTHDGLTPKSTTADVAKLLKKFREEKVAGVILDLRRNGGGLLEEAISLAGLFIKDGPIVQIKHFDGDVDVREDTDPSIAWGGPLIVLTSRFSASASEIVAAALQDYGRALIVGDKSTFGKGTAQQLFSLAKIPQLAALGHDPGTLKLTNSKFYRVSGESTEERGVAADVVLPSLYNDSTLVGEVTLDNFLRWDTIASSTFDKVNMVQSDVAELGRLSGERVATNREFDYVREDIRRAQKLEADKTTSLNEKQLLADRQDIITQHKLREKERDAQKIVAPREYDFNLVQAGQPGLPPPASLTNGVSSVDHDSAIPTHVDEGDEALEATYAEIDRADAARLAEAENIMMDYIRLREGAKPNAPILAQ